MEKKKKEIILLIVLIPIMIFFIIHAVTATKKKSPPVTASEDIVVSEDRSQPPPSELSVPSSDRADLLSISLLKPGPEEEARKEISRKAMSEKVWPRDPFLPVVVKTPVDPLAGLRLDGIIWNPPHSTATIGGNPYGVGDTFRNFTIKEITRDTVKLERDGNEINLKIGR